MLPNQIALRLKGVQTEHGHHGHDMPYYDPADGVVCACGHVFGVHLPEFDELSSVAQPAATEDAPQVDEVAAESALVTRGREVLAEIDPITAGVALIDPTMPYGPKEVEQHILDATARLERGIAYEASLVAAAHDATMRYTLAFNRALADQSGGDARWREAKAATRCEDEYTAMMVAISVRDAMKATTHSLRSVLSGYQSVSKSVSAAYNATNAVESANQRRADQSGGRYF